MAPKTTLHHLALALGLLLLMFATLIPQSVSAAPLSDTPAIPDLTNFISSVENGNANTLSGVYVGGLFALRVVQQPPYNAGYVSTIADTLTQFDLAAQYGNIGLLAHDFLSGQNFLELTPGERVILIYGDGHIEAFRITNIYRYQATDPYSMKSNFIDLDTNEYLTGNQLFKKVYMGALHVTFQTCISNNGNSSWGRLFVIAEPETSQASSAPLN